MSQSKALVMSHTEGKPGQVYYPLSLTTTILPSPTPSTIHLVPTHHSLNHRDLFLRQSLYPSPSFTTPLLSDTCATEPTTGQRYILNPGHGWDSSPTAPEGNYAILGGTKLNPLGTAQTALVVERDEIVKVPPHLSSAEAAALPLAGLTAWRALVTKSGIWDLPSGSNILITGIGGGVALFTLQFAVAAGKNISVYVTSSSPDKISKAIALGAKGGVNYKDPKWERELQTLLPEDRPYLDAVIDGAGADVLHRIARVIKPGGVVVSYGMTAKPVLEMPMGLVLKNVDVRGTMMGSRREFRQMVEFVAEKGVKPVVDQVYRGEFGDLGMWEKGWERMKSGGQTGKVVFEIIDALKGVEGGSKL